MNARCASRTDLRCPSIFPVAADSVARLRRDHFTTDDAATLNRNAIDRQLFASDDSRNNAFTQIVRERAHHWTAAS
jgi:hypothetical protein